MDIGMLNYDVNVNSGKFKRQLRAMERDANQSANGMLEAFKRLAAFLAAGKLFADGIGAARSFSKELANIKSVAGELNKNTLAREISNVNAALGDSAQIANAVYFAYSAGVRGTEKELVKFTETIAGLAKAIGADVTPVMDAATTMMNAYGLSVKDAGMLSDWFYMIVKAGKTTGPELANALGMIASTAATAKIPIDQLGAAIATLTTTMPTAQAITSLNQTILAFVKPTDDARAVAAQFGIELSAGALASKGLAGALAEINAKAGDNVTALTAMFTSVDAFKAAASLAGTQAQTFQNNVTEFANKAGAATQGLKEQLDNFDSRLNGLEVILKKFMRAVTEVIYNVISFGGALNGVFDSMAGTKTATIETTAKIIALVAGMTLLHRIISQLDGARRAISNIVGTKFEKNRLETEATAVANAECRKALEKEVADKRRSASDSRRHLREMTNSRRETEIVIAAEKMKLTATEQRLMQEQILNEKNRSANLLGKNSNTPGFIAAQKGYTDQKKKVDDLNKSLGVHNQKVLAARQGYFEASNATRIATAQLNAHNAAVTVGTAKTGALRIAWNSFTTAIMANPLGIFLTAITVAITGVTIALNKVEARLRVILEAAQKEAERASSIFAEGREKRVEDLTMIRRLEQLNSIAKPTTAQLDEMANTFRVLQERYAATGLAIDETTGKLQNQGIALKKIKFLIEANEKVEREQAMKAKIRAVEAAKAAMDANTGRRYSRFGSYKAFKPSNLSPEDLERFAVDPDIKSQTREQINAYLAAQDDLSKFVRQQSLRDQVNSASSPQGIEDEQKIKDAERSISEMAMTDYEREYAKIEKRWIDFQAKRTLAVQSYESNRYLSEDAKQAKFNALAEAESKLKTQILQDVANLDSQITQKSIDESAQLAEQRRKIAMSNAEASVWQDGFLSNQEKADLKHLEVMHEEQRMLEANAQLQNAQNESAMLGARAAIAAAQSRMAQMRAEFAQILNGSHEPRRNDAAFSAQVLNILGGDTMSVQDRIAKASEESARYLKELYYIQDDNNVIVLR